LGKARNGNQKMESDDRFGGDISLLQSILDSLVVGIVSIDREGTITVFNEAAMRLMGVPREQALGKPLLSVLPNAGLVNVLRTGEPETARTQLIGQRSVLTNRSPIIHKGVMIGAVSLFLDITEMERISRELDSTKTIMRTLEEILSGAGEWTVVVDVNGIITMMSEDTQSSTGLRSPRPWGGMSPKSSRTPACILWPNPAWPKWGKNRPSGAGSS